MAHGSLPVAPAATYARRPPAIANLDLVAPDDRAALEARWHVASEVAPAISLHQLGEATVAAPGVVWLPGGKVVTESLHNMQVRDRIAALAAGAPEAGPTASSSALLMARAGSMNYGHWLVEHLGALLLLRAALPQFQAPLLVNDPRGAAMLRVYEDSAALAGLNPTALLPVGKQAVGVAELMMLSPASAHSYMKHPAAIHALAQLAPRREAKDLLFVRRTSTAKRVLLNLDAIEAEAKALGFRTIVPGRMSFEEQIHAFAGARVVAGVSGADLANIAFMPEGGEVICLLPSRGREFFFWDICCICQHQYWSVFGHAVTARGGGHDDFTVDLALVTCVLGKAVRSLGRSTVS